MSFKYHPNHITSLSMRDVIDTTTKMPGGDWQPARPISCPTVLERIRLAWMVLIGKADALTWPNQN